MAIDLSKELKAAERKISEYSRLGQAIPTNLLDYYTNLLSAVGRITSEGGGGRVSSRSVSFGSLTPVILNSSAVVATGTGKVTSFYYSNGTATAHFLQVHIGTEAPSFAAVPLYSFRIRANADLLIGDDYWNDAPAVNLAIGAAIYFVRSSTEGTFTGVTLTGAGATLECHIESTL